MKKFILLVTLVTALYADLQAQQSFAKTNKRKSIRRISTNSGNDALFDSAEIYHGMAWEFYKAGDLGQARYYWEKSGGCVAHLPEKYKSLFRLGLMHQEGEGVGKNYYTAFYYYNQAYANGASYGCADATKNIAAYYENGIAVPKDYAKALEWYRKAKKQGNMYCDEDIARLEAKIRNGER